MATETPRVAPPRAEVPMVDAEVVRQIRELHRGGWGAKRIARELEVARNTVRRYLRLRTVEALPELRRRAGLHQPGGRPCRGGRSSSRPAHRVGAGHGDLVDPQDP